jgi:hypothetical protein
MIATWVSIMISGGYRENVFAEGFSRRHLICR